LKTGRNLLAKDKKNTLSNPQAKVCGNSEGIIFKPFLRASYFSRITPCRAKLPLMFELNCPLLSLNCLQLYLEDKAVIRIGFSQIIFPVATKFL
jgi:hypothetical protein